MLSSSFSISEFIDKVKGRSYFEIIQLTDQEATEAERCLYKACQEGQLENISNYTGDLKDFILYMRHGVRTKAMRKFKLDDFPCLDK